MKFTTLLFDADGTLLDFDATEKRALQRVFDLHHYPLTNEMKKRYQDINAQLWSAYEEGEISREAVIYTRFGKLFREFGIADDGIAFEDIYQKELGRGHDMIPHAMEVVRCCRNTVCASAGFRSGRVFPSYVCIGGNRIPEAGPILF